MTEYIKREDVLKRAIPTPIAPVLKGDSVHYEPVIMAENVKSIPAADVMEIPNIEEDDLCGEFRYEADGRDADLLNRAAGTVEQLSAKLTTGNLNDGWIPVEVGLPDKDDMVLATIKGEGGTEVDVLFFDRFSGNFYVIDNMDIMRPIAWMPLPKPYEPKEK